MKEQTKTAHESLTENFVTRYQLRTTYNHDASYPDGHSDIVEMCIFSTDIRTGWNKTQKTEPTYTIPVSKFSRNHLFMTSIQPITDSTTNTV